MPDARKITEIITDANCTGCSACLNVCPVNAISMAENEEGFIMPRIDASCISCGKCVSVCPALKDVDFGHAIKPDCYAFRAADAIRKESSSGGLFTVLAAITLARGGWVCGAVFDETWGVKHIAANDWPTVARMRSSKYVQSHSGTIYRDVKKLLDCDRHVLFTGTPCQVAALRSFLGRDHEKLLCVDILCHGVPPQKIWKKHLAEISKGREISRIDFRDKRYGWNCLHLRVEFTDGSVYEGDNKTDAYEKGFHPNLFLRKSCADCKFCEFPRLGDLSMGDFWGVEKIIPQLRDDMGTSLVFANTSRGDAFIKNIRASGAQFWPFILDKKTLKNRIASIYKPHKGRYRFFKFNLNSPLAKSVNMGLDSEYDVGCVGIYTVPNFGGALTYYALYHVLEDMGYHTLMIERPLSSKHKPGELSRIFEAGTYPEDALAKLYSNKYEMRALNKVCEQFVVGSDQMFNNYLYHVFDKFVQLDWVQDNKKKIAYAASFGHDDIWSVENVRAEMAYFLKKYDAFSVRELSGVRICENSFGINATHVLDPVFLCSKEHYERLASLSHKSQKHSKYVGGYILSPIKEKQELIKEVANSLDCSYVVYKEFGIDADFYIDITEGSFNDQLRDLMDSTFFITDSFHGLCFSIIFHKNFIAWANPGRGLARFTSILEPLGLMDRLIYSWDDYKSRRSDLSRPIDYTEVDQKLSSLIQESRRWLSDALIRPLTKALSDFDILSRSQNELSEKLTRQISALLRRIDRLAEIASNPYTSINQLEAYVKKLNENKKDLIIIMAIKDTPGKALSMEISFNLIALGLFVNLQDKHWKSYYGILDAGKLISQEISKKNETVKYTGEVSGIKLEVVSSSYISENVAKIVVNGSDKAINSRGLNFVVLDKMNGHLLDSVCFDTHISSYACLR